MTRLAASALTLVGLGLAACGAETGPPATGAGSSAPSAVEQAYHGSVGGANANTPIDAGTSTVPRTP